METNTSGRRCSPSELPESAKNLSWGAFWWSFIWGIFNNTWRSFLVIILPGLMNVILLFKGRQWAWEHRKWDSEEQFEHAQKRWGLWGLITFIVPTALIIGNGIFAYYLVKITKPEKMTEQTHSDKTHEVGRQSSSEDTTTSQENEDQESSRQEKLTSEPITAIINIAGTVGNNFLKASVALVVSDSDYAAFSKSYRRYQPQFQSFLIDFLSEIPMDKLQSNDFKEVIENNFMKYAKNKLPEFNNSIVDAQVTEFIIQ